MTNAEPITSGRFDIAQIAASLPASADTLLVDQYLTNRTEASPGVSRLPGDAASLLGGCEAIPSPPSPLSHRGERGSKTLSGSPSPLLVGEGVGG